MVAPPNAATIKFLCSYGGKILPRYPDGKLRYHGGQTRVLAVDRCISFAELLVKLGELCGTSVTLRCQLPTEDLDALVSITSDEDLANLMEEYDRASAPKIRAFLSPPKSAKKTSPSPSIATASTPRSFSEIFLLCCLFFFIQISGGDLSVHPPDLKAGSVSLVL
ncbi:octicosapeptide/Phox/Bem1p (PB1) domain-containing protein [Actinidia rufa]|uniref:Octicosapeptide/Phox/Bem1p (PB1) domain-containing protein n=1 Tax=Actinidia rufa TaxID=165716 RepID=A0A7J0EPK2_9ERIC|nr:octicosapeptide/Phox/Bem1p (PB1) domain-containing protein [Actinidia rufa]